MLFHGSGIYQWDTFGIRKRGTDEFHVFYLQTARPGSTRTSEEPACWGHAFSTNLLDWTELPPVPPPMPKGCIGDLQSWTGSIIDWEGRYSFYYTARSSDTNGRQQLIFLATSDDLMHWEPYEGNPVLTPDPRWYDTYEKPGIGILMLQCQSHVGGKGPVGVLVDRSAAFFTDIQLDLLGGYAEYQPPQET